MNHHVRMAWKGWRSAWQQRPERERHWLQAGAGLLALFALTGTTVGSIVWGRIADRIGRRAAILLIGGDKTGQGRWYEVYVPLADRLYDEHLAQLRKEGQIDGQEV